MAKWANTTGTDQALNWWMDADKLYLCTGQPADYTAASATLAVGNVTPTFTGPAAGSPNGRSITVAAKTGIAITVSGTVTHLALTKATGTLLKYVTTTTSQGVSSGGTADTGAWNINISDPS